MGAEAKEGGAKAIIDIGWRSTNITFVNGSAPIYFHNAPVGAGGVEGMERALETDPLTAPGSDDGWDGPINAFAGELAREVTRALGAARAEGFEAGISKILVLGAGGASKRIRAALEKKLDIETSPISYPRVDIPDPAGAGAIAGALIAAGAARGEVMDLASEGHDKRHLMLKSRAQPLVAVILLAAIGLLGIISFASELVLLGRKYESAKSDVRENFHRALPDVKTVVSESQQLKNAFAKLEEKSKSLGAGLYEKDPFLERFLDISRAAPADMRLDVDELVYEQGKVILSGRTESYEKVELLKSNIEKLPWAGKVTVERAKASPTADAIIFRIEMRTV